jgi:renalase
MRWFRLSWEYAMNDGEYQTDVLIVGAGMTGLAAASELQRAGYTCLVIDKGRGVGGRLASRRIGRATFDHGAQFMTARHPRFAAQIDKWLHTGVVEEWYRSPGGRSEGHARWRGTPTMTALPKHLARNVEVLLGKSVVSLRSAPAGWVAQLESGKTFFARAVLLTAPVPQALALLEAGRIELPQKTEMQLKGIQYERCLAVLAVLSAPARIPWPGGLAPEEDPLSWIADNQTKGVSVVPAVTIHATAAFSLQRWDSDRRETGRTLLRTAESLLGLEVVEFQVHGWLYGRPVRVEESPCLILNTAPPLVVAGDAFGGPRVEGAALSGWAAAEALRRIDLDSA